eukprot:CAMPEP_0171198182 /NCGR_PEP_ID=MMETSP0790-20130122/22798_1 /TAXON_ID=2925 /ORGANISM="Alexandrium catenella, Strain OF101" /LENGTH=410 /DNA_ID=CAMNT_0011663453 /DNA_START=64 /DNA_END=1293 /DNA_ORIENTATION=-
MSTWVFVPFLRVCVHCLSVYACTLWFFRHFGHSGPSIRFRQPAPASTGAASEAGVPSSGEATTSGAAVTTEASRASPATAPDRPPVTTVAPAASRAGTTTRPSTLPQRPATSKQKLSWEAQEALGSKHCASRRSSWQDLARCSREGTLVVSSADSRYAKPLVRLAKTAASVGRFPCLVIYAQEDWPELCDERVFAVRLRHELLPTPEFCRGPWSRLWGWRRTQFYKTFALRSLLHRGYDVLMLDADHWFRSDPWPCMQRAAGAGGFETLATRSTGDMHYVNFGLAWIRRTAATLLMSERLHNRTFGGWDQFLWNQEMEGLSLACCSSKELASFLGNDKALHSTKAAPMASHELRCATLRAPTLGMPEKANKTFVWDRWKFNEGGWHGGRVYSHCRPCPVTCKPVSAPGRG